MIIFYEKTWIVIKKKQIYECFSTFKWKIAKFYKKKNNFIKSI